MLLQMALFHSIYDWVIFPCVYIPHLYLFIYHWTLGCFHVLAVVNGAATNIGVNVSFRIMIFSRYLPRSGVAGSYGNSVFKEISIQFSIVTVPSYMPTNNARGFPFLHTVSSMLFVDFFIIAFLTIMRWHLIVTRVFFLKHGSGHIPPFSMPFPCVFFKKLVYSMHRLSIAVCAWAFSSCSKWGLLSSCGVPASPCGGFSCWGAQILGHVGFSSCSMGSEVVVHGLSCSVACGILVPRPGTELMSPVLAGIFLTTGPPGKSPPIMFWLYPDLGSFPERRAQTWSWVHVKNFEPNSYRYTNTSLSQPNFFI